jgi:uncharacterized membrane protein
METNKNYWKAGVIITLIFLIGYLAGAGTLLSVRYVMARNRDAMRNPAKILSVLNAKLNLDQEQKTAVQNILYQTRRDLIKLREATRPQLIKRLEQSRDEIAALLNEEQQVQFDRFVEERLARFMRMRPRVPLQ